MYASRVDGGMCRLFGLLTTRNDVPETWLVRADRSLLAQAHASPETAQRDGWGVGWFTDGGRTRVVKGVHGAFEEGERDRFLAAAKASAPPLVIGHLRHASNPLGLPSERLLGLENSQPFETHAQLFAHNGAIPFPTETRPLLGVHEGSVRGVNDSEVLFWLMVRNTEETHDPLRGYLQSVEDLVRIWQGLGRPKVPPFSGLNVLYAPGPGELWAFCLWTGDHGAGLLDPGRRYYEMAYQATPHRIVVGSEPFDGEKGAWTSLASGSYVRAVRDGEHVRVTPGTIPIPRALEVGPVPA
jgi:predicted glutamine amidotransferase